MSSLFPLEDFGSLRTQRKQADVAPSSEPQPPVAPNAREIEAERMAAYEQGYKAGWDDAANTQKDEQSKIGADFARNLQDLGFTFHEARSHVMRAMEPLLGEIVSKVLPSLVSDTIGQTILEELLPLAESASDAPIQLMISPASRAGLDAILSESMTVPLEIIEEPSLAEGQVYLKMGKIEKHIDMTGAVDRIGQAIRSVYALNQKAAEHG